MVQVEVNGRWVKVTEAVAAVLGQEPHGGTEPSVDPDEINRRVATGTAFVPPRAWDPAAEAEAEKVARAASLAEALAAVPA